LDRHESSWQRQLVIGLSALLAIAVLVGGILGVIALKAADYAGIGNSVHLGSTPDVILPTTGDASTTPSNTAPSTTTKTSPTRTTRRRPPRRLITLAVSPKHAGSYQRVNLTGTYPGHDGASLQVQRSLGQGPWADFPTGASVSGGTFATFIETGMVGINHFRMLDKATGKTSNTVAVRIG
jgi:hypothetical protein